MTDELVPCPFCAGKATKLFLSGDGIVVRLYREATVYGCQICQVFRPSRPAWNARIASTRPDSALGDMAQFLIDRIDDMDWCGDLEAFAREWNGHVDPPLCRLRAALASEEPK